MRKLLFFICFTAFVQCENQSRINKPDVPLFFDPNTMTQDAIVNEMYSDTIHLINVQNASDSLVIILLNSSSADMQLEDSFFTWIPKVSDTGNTVIQCAIMLNDRMLDTISWNIKVKGYWPENCGINTHKEDATVSDASMLPAGFFIYNPNTETGVYRSEIQQFNSQLIPNTFSDRPGNLSISDDGRWICYVDRSRNRICLLTINGCQKTIVPVCDTAPGFPTIAGFYRKSPYGNEIFYLASNKLLKSISVQFSSDKITFSNDRVLADLKDEYRFNKDDFMQISVVKDQIFSEISPYVDGALYSRTGYLTIPDQGRGVGGPVDVYKWKDDILITVDGCGHTQSHDGVLCLANPGSSIGSPQCVPHGHKGFYITAFRRITDPAVNLFSEHVDKFALSINWCPLNYHNYGSEVDFWGWYFGNRNDLVIGRQMGSLNQNGIWMIDWEKNIWYRLTPMDKNIQTMQPAVYFYKNDSTAIISEQCEEDTTEKPLPYNPADDLFNPYYQIKYPNGGQSFYIGEKCTVKVASIRDGNAVLNISYNNGLNWSQLPGLNRSINPLHDSTIVFTIPDSVSIGRKKISTISTECWLQLMDYGNANYFDISDNAFSINKQ